MKASKSWALSILSGSRMPLVEGILRWMRAGSASARRGSWSTAPCRPRAPRSCWAAGVARVCTPKDYEIQDIMSDLVEIAAGYEWAA